MASRPTDPPVVKTCERCGRAWTREEWRRLVFVRRDPAALGLPEMDVRVCGSCGASLAAMASLVGDPATL